MGPSASQSTTSSHGKSAATIPSNSTLRYYLKQRHCCYLLKWSPFCSLANVHHGVQGIICKPLNSREATFYEQVPITHLQIFSSRASEIICILYIIVFISVHIVIIIISIYLICFRFLTCCATLFQLFTEWLRTNSMGIIIIVIIIIGIVIIVIIIITIIPNIEERWGSWG